MALAPSSDAPRGVTVLGATGSVGRSTLALLAEAPERYRVEALTANRDAARLAVLARRHRARLAVVADPLAYTALKDALAGSGVEAAAGPGAVTEAAERPAEWVMAAIVGSAGLPATLAAVRRGALVAFANKECLVCAGELFMAEVKAFGAVLLPVDSEHNALFQVLRGEAPAAVDRIILTASGGPFRRAGLETMRRATPEVACAHPVWSMGRKISIDSATMMNKGLEVIEASHLFGLPEERIEVLVHPQSTVHGLVAFKDGSLLAQLGAPDMKIPIAYALGWPERLAAATPRLDLAASSGLTFEAPDPVRFPALRLAREALRAGGTAPTILNAANEVAVEAFLAGRLGFLDIAAVVGATLDELDAGPLADLDHLNDADRRARHAAARLVLARAVP